MTCRPTRLPTLARALRAACAAALLAVAGAPVAAQEAGADDAIARLLAERGLASPAPNPTVPAAPSAEPGLAQAMRDRATDAVLAAMNFVGVPYRRGGNSADAGFDCSGFTRHVFESALGLVLPRRVDDQASAPGLVSVRRDELQPGDLVFFNTLRRTFSHVGIYVGEGRFVHAPRPGGEVRIENMRYAYWAKRFTGARRAALVAQAPSPPGTATAAPH